MNGVCGGLIALNGKNCLILYVNMDVMDFIFVVWGQYFKVHSEKRSLMCLIKESWTSCFVLVFPEKQKPKKHLGDA